MRPPYRFPEDITHHDYRHGHVWIDARTGEHQSCMYTTIEWAEKYLAELWDRGEDLSGWRLASVQWVP
jgi:hypothetical protein